MSAQGAREVQKTILQITVFFQFVNDISDKLAGAQIVKEIGEQIFAFFAS